MEELEYLSIEDRKAFKKHYNQIQKAIDKLINREEDEDIKEHVPNSTEHE